MAKLSRALLQQQCLDFYYQACRERFYAVRSSVTQLRSGFGMPADIRQRILSVAKGQFNPLWAIRMITDEAIHTNRDVSGKLATITYKRAAEYASYGMDWAKQQRDAAESTCYLLTERPALHKSAFNVSLESSLSVIKTEAELDPVIELAFRRYHKLSIPEQLHDWAKACYSFFPPIYSQFDANWLRSQHLFDLFQVPDGYSVIERPAAISGLFSAESSDS